jgi:hypothetical protein
VAVAAEEEKEEKEEDIGNGVSGRRGGLRAILLGRLTGMEEASGGRMVAEGVATGNRTGGPRACGWEKAIPASVDGVRQQTDTCCAMSVLNGFCSVIKRTTRNV